MANSDYMESVTRHTYNKAAEDWKKVHSYMDYWALEFGIFHRVFGRLGRGRVDKKRRVLDIGCGFGRDFHFFKEEGHEYVGVDFSKGMLAEARCMSPDAQFVSGDMQNLPFKDKSFDGFWAIASLLHIRKRNISKVLKGIHSKMKSGAVGMIVIKEGEGEVIDPGDSWSKGGAPRFFAYYKMPEFRKILEKSGFEVVWAKGVIWEKERDPNWLRFIVRVASKSKARRKNETSRN